MRRNTIMASFDKELVDILRENIYVEKINEQTGKIFYTKQFFIDLYKQLEIGELTAVQAYSKLGFEVEQLGKTRAEQAAKKAREKAKKNQLRIKMSDFDGSIPREEMGELTEEEELAYFKARTFYLEKVNMFLKKTSALLEEKR
jgi:hypothetical protein